MSHLGLVADAKSAINKVFSDRSVDSLTTQQSLEEIREEIDMLIDSLEETRDDAGAESDG